MAGSNNPTSSEIGAIHTTFPLQMSFEPLTSHTSGSMDSLGLTSCHKETSVSHCGGRFQAQNNLSITNPPQLQLQLQLQNALSSTRTRAPKAPTMSAKKWKPSESRIKQLYVFEEKSIKQLREIVNKEFGFIAT